MKIVFYRSQIGSSVNFYPIFSKEKVFISNLKIFKRTTKKITRTTETYGNEQWSGVLTMTCHHKYVDSPARNKQQSDIGNGTNGKHNQKYIEKKKELEK